MALPMVYPRALLALTGIVRRGTGMSSKEAERTAHRLIQALHREGLQVGPLAGFGPHDSSAGARDAFDNLDQVLQQLEDRDPWHELR